MRSDLLEINQFEVRYEAKPKAPSLVIDSLSIEAPSLVALIGPNGSGKSTLMKSLCGLQDYTGHITWNGRLLGSLDPQSRSQLISYVPQVSQIAYDLTTRDMALLGRFPWHKGHPSKQDQLRVGEALRICQAEHIADRSVRLLSGGEFKKAQLVRALAGESPIIILDEPCAFLDHGARKHLLELLQSLSTSRTILLSIHEIDLAQRFGKQIIALKAGRLFEVPKTKVLDAKWIDDLFRR